MALKPGVYKYRNAFIQIHKRTKNRRMGIYYYIASALAEDGTYREKNIKFGAWALDEDFNKILHLVQEGKNFNQYALKTIINMYKNVSMDKIPEDILNGFKNPNLMKPFIALLFGDGRRKFWGDEELDTLIDKILERSWTDQPEAERERLKKAKKIAVNPDYNPDSIYYETFDLDAVIVLGYDGQIFVLG
jgi:hypothetical protein